MNREEIIQKALELDPSFLDPLHCFAEGRENQPCWGSVEEYSLDWAGPRIPACLGHRNEAFYGRRKDYKHE